MARVLNAFQIGINIPKHCNIVIAFKDTNVVAMERVRGILNYSNLFRAQLRFI
jgi:hypothetical protein